jgi:hypothetical protein
VRAGAGEHGGPVGFAVHDGDAGDGRLGQVGAAVMVGVRMRIDRVLDVPGVEAEELESLVDFIFGRVLEVAVDQDDVAPLGYQRIGAVISRAEEVEVVADLCRRRIPVGAWRGAALRRGQFSAGVFGGIHGRQHEVGSRNGRYAKAHVSARPIRAGILLRGRLQRLDGWSWRRLRDCRIRGECNEHACAY